MLIIDVDVDVEMMMLCLNNDQSSNWAFVFYGILVFI